MADMEKHKKTKTILKITGISLIAVSLVFIIMGFIDVFSVMSKQDMRMPKIYLLMIGFPLFAVGMTLTINGFRREISTYVKNESVPVFNEMGKEIVPGVSAISGAVFNKAVICPKCNEVNEAGSKFCKKCGEPLQKVCVNCGHVLDAGSEFCPQCGVRVRKDEDQ